MTRDSTFETGTKKKQKKPLGQVRTKTKVWKNDVREKGRGGRSQEGEDKERVLNDLDWVTESRR